MTALGWDDATWLLRSDLDEWRIELAGAVKKADGLEDGNGVAASFCRQAERWIIWIDASLARIKGYRREFAGEGNVNVAEAMNYLQTVEAECLKHRARAKE